MATAAPPIQSKGTGISQANATTLFSASAGKTDATTIPNCQDRYPLDGLGGAPTHHGWFASSWFAPGNRVPHVTPGGDARSAHNRHLPSYHSRPPPLDAAAVEGGDRKLGGAIISPRASNRERLAQTLKTSRYDMATLATTKYHGGEDGIQFLT